MIYGKHVGYATENIDGPDFEDYDSYFGNITPEMERREKEERAARAKKLIDKKAKDLKAKGIEVECMECCRKFNSSSILPVCPKCGGSDIDIR